MGITLFAFLLDGCEELFDSSPNNEDDDVAWVQHPYVEPENRITEIVWEGMYEDESTTYFSEETSTDKWYKLIEYNPDGTLAAIYNEGEASMPVTWDESHNMPYIFNNVKVTYSDKPNIWCGVSINAFLLYHIPGALVINDSIFHWHTANIPKVFESSDGNISFTIFTDDAGRITSGYLNGGWRDGERFRIGYGGNPSAFNPEIEDSANDPESGTSYSAVAGEAIDLGLSVKWMSFNLGATKPEEYGDYFAWGETEPKSEYSWDNYVFGNSYSGPFSKYNTNSDYGTVDNKTVLEEIDDVAKQALGGKWRMPTYEDWEELRTSCTWAWSSENGVYGIKVTGPSGNSIFLPSAGSMKEKELLHEGIGYYWSSSLDADPDGARNVYFYANEFYQESRRRYRGQSVRPVSE